MDFLDSTSLVRKMLIPVIICFSITVILSLPLLLTGSKGAFYSIDPDVVYVANALSYIKFGSIGYIDHPGTVAISVLSIAYIPLRIYTKIFLHQNFITWSFFNYSFLFFLSRLFQSVLFFIGALFFSQAVYKVTRSHLITLFSISLLFLFTPIYYLVLSISADTTAFLICSLWLFVFSIYLKRKNQGLLYLLSFISGVAFADRATTFFFELISLALSVYYEKERLKNISRILLYSVIFSLIGFLIGIWPVRNQIVEVLSRLIFFANSSGVHGSGVGNFLDIFSYIESLKSYAFRNAAGMIVFILVIATSIREVLVKKDKNIGIVGIIVCFGTMVFIKFPLEHYLIPNFILICYLASYFVLQFDIKCQIILIIVAFLAILPVSRGYYVQLTDALGKERTLEKFNALDLKHPIVWSWARSESFAKLWTLDWSGGVFKEELNYQNGIFELNQDLVSVRNYENNAISLNKFCQSSIYLQESILPEFLKKNSSARFDIMYLSGTDNIVRLVLSNC